MTFGKRKFRLVYIVTEQWFFTTHFLPIARAARDAGFEVVIVTKFGNDTDKLERDGFRLINLSANRSSVGLASLLLTVYRLRSILMQERPDVIHAIALRSVILGGLANVLGAAVPGIYSLTGLGYLWSGKALSLRMARAMVRLALSLLPLRSRAVFTFENDDDASEFPKLAHKVVIGGWGINVDTFRVKDNRDGKLPVTVLYLGRMLKAKGIDQAIKAVQLARKTEDLNLELWGTPDPENITSLTESQLLEYSKLNGITWHGWAADVSEIWQRADIAILLSEREGMPRSLLEAAATGLPMVAYDVAGCRSIVKDGLNGFLAPAGDIQAVAAALIRLARDEEMRKQMGLISRSDFERKFSTENIVPRITAIYLNLVRSPDMR